MLTTKNDTTEEQEAPEKLNFAKNILKGKQQYLDFI
jgi:hypothetical protein